MIELNQKQLEGLELAVARYRAGEKCTIISGYAGTGKSTLVKFIIAALAQDGIDPDKDVVFAQKVATFSHLFLPWYMFSIQLLRHCLPPYFCHFLLRLLEFPYHLNANKDSD